VCSKTKVMSTRSTQCGDCWRTRGSRQPAAPANRLKPCPDPLSRGCTNQIKQSYQQCKDCYNETRARQRQVPVERAERRLAGQETDTDRIARENIELRQANQRAQTVIKQYEARQSFEDRIHNLFADSLASRPYVPTLSARPKITKGTKAKAHEMLVLVSDAHYPEVVEAAATGLTYNSAVCRARIEHIRDTVIRYRDLRSSSYPVRKLTIGVIGDMLSGDIHDELEITNEQPMSQALAEMGDMLFDFGYTLSTEFPDVEMVVMPGNHPRLTKKPRYKQKWNNWEHVLGLYVRALAEQGGFTVRVPKELVYRHRIFGKVVGLSHGDGIKSNSFAGIPWYAMKQRQDALQSLLRTLGEDQIDLLCYGHFHQLIYQEGQGCGLIINGSIKGGDEYSIGSRYANQEPVQALVTFHPEHGITDVSRINLGQVQ
jgi:predicted phosphodiesterase